MELLLNKKKFFSLQILEGDNKNIFKENNN